MKAVVIKIKNKKAVVLKTDGTFCNVQNKSYVIGQEIYIEKISKTANFQRLATYAAAAAAAIIVLIGGVSYAYSIPQSYISMDFNPSIEFEVNIFNRVINPQGVNQDGIELLNRTSIENKNIEDAIHAVVSQLKSDGYVISDDKSFVLGVQSNNEKRRQKMMESAQMQLEKSLESLHLSAQVAVNPVTEQDIEHAHDAGTTGGKLELIEEYLETYPDGLSFDELISMTVSDILYELNHGHTEDGEYENEDDYYEDYDDEDDEHDEDDNNEDAEHEDDEHSEDEIDDNESEEDEEVETPEPDVEETPEPDEYDEPEDEEESNEEEEHEESSDEEDESSS